MQVTIEPQALPNNCMFCPMSKRDLLIDTGISFEWYGAVYICSECVIHMGRLLGMLSVDQSEELRLQVSQLLTENFELKTRNAHLESAVNGLRGAGFLSLDTSIDSSSSSDLSDDESDATDTSGSGGSDEGDVREGELPVNEDHERPTEPAHDETVGVVPEPQSERPFRLSI